MQATTPRLYVFGTREPQFPDYAPPRFVCLYSIANDTSALEMVATKETDAGHEAYIHAGETAVDGDRFGTKPVNPSADLAAAMERAGW
jgi:hypothetical protein